MHLNNILQTATFRLATLYVLLFAASVAALGMIAYLIISFALERRLEARIAGEMTSLLAAFKSGGLAALEARVDERERTHAGGSLNYLVLDKNGQHLAGQLPNVPTQLGWSDIKVKESNGDIGHLRVLMSAAGIDGRVAVAADREDIEEAEEAVRDGFTSAFAAVLVLGMAGGIALSLTFLKRVETIRRTAEAIIGGDLTRRVPLRGTGDDLDRLSQTLNRMLDRIAELMESLRQVSADIAHDLKTPLTRLRQRLESTRSDASSLSPNGTLVEDTVENIDGILATFDALLRIAQIESRTRRAAFRAFDLSEVSATVIDAFAPSAEDAGKCMRGRIEPEIFILGDRELVTQMLANLVENAVRHTPAGTRIEVSLCRERQGVVASVSDNGPGVPEGERKRIFRRLYRLEQSRLTPGSGLGLSLVKAIADLHDISLEVLDADPGLRIVMKFQQQREPRSSPKI